MGTTLWYSNMACWKTTHLVDVSSEISIFLLGFRPAMFGYFLVMTNSLLLKMAHRNSWFTELQLGDFPVRYVNVYQRLLGMIEMTSQGISWDQQQGIAAIFRQAAGPSHSWSLGKEILRFDHDQSAIGDGQVPIRAAPRAGYFMGKIWKNHRFKKAVKGSETAQFCTVHGRYFYWIHIAWFLGIQFLQHFGMALATSVDTTNSVNRMRKAWKSSDATPSCWPAPYSMSTATWTQDLRKTAKITKRKGETSATKLGVWNFFQAMGWKVISILQHHQSLVCWAISKLLGKPQDQLGELGTSKIQKVNTCFIFFWFQKIQKHIEIPRKRAESQT